MFGRQQRTGAARRAARFGLPFQPAVNTPEVLELYRSECERLGVEKPVAIPPGSGEMVYVSEDPERTWAEIGKYLLYEAQTYASWQPPGQRSAVCSDANSVEELRAEKRYLVLTPEECVPSGPRRGAWVQETWRARSRQTAWSAAR